MITDLPGIYSMSPYSSEEIVTREFLLNNRPKGIINILDATNIERNFILNNAATIDVRYTDGCSS